MRIDKTYALQQILYFGIREEHSLIEAGKHHEAYQYRHARETMIKQLMNSSVKSFMESLDKMVNSSIDKNGYLEYDPTLYVFDKDVRTLVEKFKNFMEEVKETPKKNYNYKEITEKNGIYLMPQWIDNKHSAIMN